MLKYIAHTIRLRPASSIRSICILVSMCNRAVLRLYLSQEISELGCVEYNSVTVKELQVGSLSVE